MSEKGWTILGVVATIVFGVPAWWSLFVEHPDVITELMWAMRVMLPVGTFLAGVFTGWHLRRWRSESSDYQITEEIKGMSSEARAVLAYLIDSIAPVAMEGGDTPGQIVQLGLLEVKNSGLVRWDPAGNGVAIVTVLPEVRNAIGGNRRLWQSMKHGDLPLFKTHIAAHDVETLENDVARLYGHPEAQALRTLVEWPGQIMREDRARRLANRLGIGAMICSPDDDEMVVVGLDEETRQMILEEMDPILDRGEYVDVSGLDYHMRADAIEEEIERGERW